MKATRISPVTGKPMRLQFQKSNLWFKDQYIRYTHLSYLCQDSGESYTDTDLDDLNLYQVYQKYAFDNNMPIEQVIPQEDNTQPG